MKNPVTFYKTLIFFILVGCSFLYGQTIPAKENIIKNIPKHASNQIAPQFSGKNSYNSWYKSIGKEIVKKESLNDKILDSIKAENLMRKKTWLADNKIINYDERQSETSGVVSPQIVLDWKGNDLRNLTPTDNAIAVSDYGMIVTCDNYCMEVFDQTGLQLINDLVWSDFFPSDILTSTFSDPIVIYDPEEDRFVLIIMHGSSSMTSKLIVAFSTTSDPTEGWIYYMIDGDITDDNQWIDFPKIGLTTDDIVITGNLYDDYDVFQQALILMFPKSQGYNSEPLTYLYFSNIIDVNGNKASSISPATSGISTLTDKEFYLIDNYGSGGNEVFLYKITGDYLSDDIALNSWSIPTNNYSPAADAVQLFTTDLLEIIDCRIVSSFYFNNYVHFAFTSEREGFGVINYNRLNVDSLINYSTTLGLPGFDYAYPAVMSVACDETPSDLYTNLDPSVLLVFLRTSNVSYPEFRVVGVDHNMEWTDGSIQIQQGFTYVDLLAGTAERWGDYTGISKKFNAASPTIFAAGAYGNPSVYRPHGFTTFIAKLNVLNELTCTTILDQLNPITSQININNTILTTNLYPNPAKDFLNIDLDLTENESSTIELYNSEGKLIKTLFHEKTLAGKYTIQFNLNALTQGTYFIIIKTETGNQIVKKFIKN